jgi:hypothetical protein
VVIAEQAAQAFTALDEAGRPPDFVSRVDKFVLESLVVSFRVIMIDEFRERLFQRCLAKEDHSIEAFRFQASHEPLEMCIAIGASRWQQGRFHVGILFQKVAQRCELRIAVDKDVRVFSQETINRIDEVRDICRTHAPFGFVVRPAI